MKNLIFNGVLMLAFASSAVAVGKTLNQKMTFHNVEVVLQGEDPENPLDPVVNPVPFNLATTINFPSQGVWISRLPENLRNKLNPNLSQDLIHSSPNGVEAIANHINDLITPTLRVWNIP